MSKRYESMGVINITPDSFSDGNKYNQKEQFKKQFLKFKDTFDIIDLGAESTAPMNSAVSASDEIERFEESFIPLLKAISTPNVVISVDTYKIEVFNFVLKKIRKYWGSEIPVIFNDVSGKIDSDLKDLLTQDLKFRYVFSHNLAPTRIQTTEHMDHVSEYNNEEFVESVRVYFQNGIDELREFPHEIIIDPCFGFSKTRSQNHLLLRELSSVFKKIENKLLIGISRKSFLRDTNFDKENTESVAKLDVSQAVLLAELLKGLDSSPILRVHDKISLDGMDTALDILENCQKVLTKT